MKKSLFVALLSLPAHFFSLGAYAAPPSVAEALASLETLEQVAVYGAPKNQITEVEMSRSGFEQIARPFLSQMMSVGIRTEDEAPFHWDFESWVGKDSWTATWSRENRESQCEILRLSYLFAIWKLDTLEPTLPNLSVRDLMRKKVSSDLLRDRERAAWAMRYVRGVPSKLVPSDCEKVTEEAKARWDFIFTERKPLGFAIGMCGRPMSAHYIDAPVMAKLRPAPEGWTIKSIRR